MNLLSKIGKIITGNTQAHDGTMLTTRKVMEILNHELKIIKHKSVFQLCDIFIMKFKS